MPTGYTPENNVTYFLNDAKEGKINLEKRGDRFTIFLDEKNITKREEQLNIVLKIVFKTAVPKKDTCTPSGKMIYTDSEIDVKEVSEHVYKVVYRRLNDISVVDEVMDQIRKDGIVAHHAYHPAGDEHTVYYLSNRIMIGFVNTSSISERNELCKAYKLKIPGDKLSNNMIVAEVTLDSGENPVKVANKIALESIVETAEPSLIYRINKTGPEKENDLFVPRDKFFSEQWHLESRDENGKMIKDADVNALEAWETLKGGGDKNITVAVMDQNFFVTHPDLNKRLLNVFNKFDFATPEDPFPPPLSDVGFGDHGTKCAGIAIAGKNDSGVAGIAYNCTFLPVRVRDSDGDHMLADYFEKVGEKADVISCSWSVEPVFARADSRLFATLKKLAESGGPGKKGCVICFAAGNYNVPVNEKLEAPLSFFVSKGVKQEIEKGTRIKNPYASHPDVIAVAASTSFNKKAAYSNYGKEISVCAPSGNFLPENGFDTLDGVGIFTTATKGNVKEIYTNKFAGTSSSTPLVAGLAALILSANKNLTARMVKYIMEITADKIGDEDPEVAGSEGRYIETEKGLHSNWFGYGKINAGRAVKLALVLNKFEEINKDFKTTREEYDKLKTELATHLEKFQRLV